MAVEQIKSRNRMLKDKKIVVYKQTRKDVNHQILYTYKPIHPGSLWAYVRQLSTSEVYWGGGLWTQDTMVFGVNWRQDVITLSHYIKYKGLFYTITRVDTYEGYKDTIKIYAVQMKIQPKSEEILPYE